VASTDTLIDLRARTLGLTSQAVAAAGALVMIILALAAASTRYPLPSVPLLILAGTAFLGLVLLALTRYDAAVFLGFLLLGVVRVEPAPPDLVFGVVIAIAAVTGRFSLERVPLAVGAVIAAFLTLNLVSAVDLVDANQAATFFSITLYLAVFAVWLTSFLDSERRARAIVIAYLIAAVVSTIAGVAALFLPVPGKDLLLYEGGERVQALFKDANVYGPFLIPITLILLEEIARPRLLKLRPSIKAVLCLILALGVLFSYSRAAWGSLVLGVVVMVLVIAPRTGGAKRAIVLVSLMLAAGAVVIMALTASGSLDFFDQRAGLQAYDTERFQAQETGVALAEEHPLGIGPGQFGLTAQLDAHSLYIRAFAEQGFLGLLAIGALMFITLVMAARNAVAGRETYGIGSAALFGAWCGLMLNSFFVDTMHWRHLWLVAALIWIGAMPRRRASL
jgi:O-antigen ligase